MGPKTAQGWAGISSARDRLQSQLLVWTVTPLLAWSTLQTVQELARGGPAAHAELLQSLAISVSFAVLAGWLRAATPAAAVCGGMVCLLLTESRPWVSTPIQPSHPFAASAVHSGLTPLVLLFLLTFASTRLGRPAKALAGLAESRRGRGASQVIANLGFAALLGPLGAVTHTTGPRISLTTAFPERALAFWLMPILAALAEATADTVSSEIGQALGGTPRMILTLQPVPPGTDGAVTGLGTLAGIAAAVLVAGTGVAALGLSSVECLTAFAAGVAGLFFDSLLGATVERRGWLGNDLVNFSSTVFAAGVAFVALCLTHAAT